MVRHSHFCSRRRFSSAILLHLQAPEVRVLSFLTWSPTPLGVDMLAAETVLSRAEVVSALGILLHEQRIVQSAGGASSLFDARFSPSATLS